MRDLFLSSAIREFVRKVRVRGRDLVDRMHHIDQRRLMESLNRLQHLGELEYTGEYGAEITTFIPFVAWLKREGYLKGRRILTYAGMRPYYCFLDDAEFATKSEKRCWLPVSERYWPSPSTYTATAKPWHVYTDYRQKFSPSGLSFQRPVMFVQNKFTVEWGYGPINFIPINSLQRLFAMTTGQFDVVYSRPGSFDTTNNGYTRDNNLELDYPDREILSAFPHVHHLERICAEGNLDYNKTKLEALAKTHLFVAVQGGSAHILACFGNSILLVFDRDGNEKLKGYHHEYPHAYRRGPYKYLAKHPPYLVVPRNFHDFNEALTALSKVEADKGSVNITNAAQSIFSKWAM